MTLGERIKYYRTHYLITSKQLAELIGVNHTTVRQYETDKLQPSPETIGKLASTFGVSTLALTDDLSGFMLETVGDLMGLILYLINKGLLTVNGERNEHSLIRSDTAVLKVNPMLSAVLSVTLHENKGEMSDLGLILKNRDLLDKLLLREKSTYLYKSISEMTERDNVQGNERVTEVLAGLEVEIETSALEVQMILEYLDDSNGKKFRVPLASNYERTTSQAADAAVSLLEEFQKEEKPRRKKKQ